jgi:hypothetical protein
MQCVPPSRKTYPCQKRKKCFGFFVLLQSQAMICWVYRPCFIVSSFRRFGGTFCLPCKHQQTVLWETSAMKILKLYLYSSFPFVLILFRQIVCMLYGVVEPCYSLNSAGSIMHFFFRNTSNKVVCLSDILFYATISFTKNFCFFQFSKSWL